MLANWERSNKILFERGKSISDKNSKQRSEVNTNLDESRTAWIMANACLRVEVTLYGEKTVLETLIKITLASVMEEEFKIWSNSENVRNGEISANKIKLSSKISLEVWYDISEAKNFKLKNHRINKICCYDNNKYE